MHANYSAKFDRNDRCIACATFCISVFLFAGCRQMGIPSSNTVDNPGGISSAAATDVQFAMAQSLEQTGKTKEAIAAYQRLATQKGLSLAMHRLGVLHDQQGEFAKAEKNYRKAIKENPESAELWCDLGYSYYLQEKWEASEQHLRKAIELDPDLVRGHNNLGLLLARLDQRDESLAAFRNAAEDDQAALKNFNYVFADRNVVPASFETNGTGTNTSDDRNSSSVLIGSEMENGSIDAALGIASSPPAGYKIPNSIPNDTASQFQEYVKRVSAVSDQDGLIQQP
jgi:tetratricopeptide (TPR) repeat protein